MSTCTHPVWALYGVAGKDAFRCTVCDRVGVSGKESSVTEDNPSTEDNAPSYDRYPDKGCEVSSTCLNCPLSRCKHDDPTEFRKLLILEDNLRLQSVVEVEGLSVNQAAERFSITERTVFRRIRAVKDAKWR